MRLEEIVAIFLLYFTGPGPTWSQPSFPQEKEYLVYELSPIGEQRGITWTYDLVDGVTYQYAYEKAWASKGLDVAGPTRWQPGSTGDYPIRVHITSATIRSFNPETRKLKSWTRAYNKTVQKLISGKDRKSRLFHNLESDILMPYQKMLERRISEINGVTAIFDTPYIGSWHGDFEPSFDLILQISENTDTERLSDVLYDLAERTSQDAFILEMKSDSPNPHHSAFYDDVGHLHYPQIQVIFETPLTIIQRAAVARALHNQGIQEFSISEAYFFVSVINFDDHVSDHITSNSAHFDQTMYRINQAMKEVAMRPGFELKFRLEILYRKSLYVKAINTEDPTDHSRKYLRHNIFETPHVFFLE